MKALNQDTNARDRIMGLRRKFGITYGVTAGIAFAVASWGWDAYLLNNAHAYYPWVMLLVGVIFSTILGGISGWLTARFESSLLGIIFWIIASAGFAWLMVALPLQINPAIVSILDPQLGALLNYNGNSEFILRFGTSLAWILPFMLLIGVIQLPISEPAVFSTSFFGRIAPLFFSIILMGLSGTFTDNLINAHFRDAIFSLDTTIQFIVDNKGNENADSVRARELHTRALWEVNEQVQQSRHIFVGSYDEYFGEFHVLVKFGDQWVDCLVLYNQPNSCKPVTGE
jgi:hypothetical protein